MKKLASLLLTLTLWAGLTVPALAAGFSDVAESSPFAPAIAWAVEKGVTKGTTPTTFGPGETCTTSHILTFLWRAAGRPGDTGNERASVPAWAAGLGIDVSDLSAPCTRAAAVTDIWKAQGSPAAGKAASFTDVDPSAPWSGAVSWAVEAGVTNGTGGGAFSPEAVCTRGQIVTFLYRALAGGGAEKPKTPETPAAGTGTLANGKPITEENVLAIIQELLVKYPAGTPWAHTHRTGMPSNAANTIAAQYTTAGYSAGTSPSMSSGCGGFASLVSDTIFGSGTANPTRKIPVENARPGDIIAYLTNDGKISHLAVVASKIKAMHACGTVCPEVEIYDGNNGGKVSYAYGCLPKSIASGHEYGYVEVWTRYPTDGTPWTGSSDSPGTSEQPSSELSGGASGSEVNWVTTDNKCGVCGKIGGRQVRSADGGRYVCEDCYNDPTGVGKWYVE